MEVRDRFNTFSHTIGAVCFLVGFVVLGRLARRLVQLFVYAVYGFSLVFLYASSAIYHAFATTERLRNRLLKLDRTAIAVLIAGTTTPIAVLKFDAGRAGIILWVLWVLVALLLLVHLLFSSPPQRFYLGLYLSMGWSALLVVESLLERSSPGRFSGYSGGGSLRGGRGKGVTKVSPGSVRGRRLPSMRHARESSG